MKIKKAKPADANAICTLLFNLKTIYGSCSEANLKDFRAHYVPTILKSITSPTNSIWIAQASDGKIVGFISMTRRLVLRLAGEVGVLEEIFVMPSWRRCGIAFRLWKHAVQEMSNYGIKTIEIVSSLAHPGQRQFARKIGYEWYSNIHRIQL
jgi:GNAT superfamily N-acetyltransferase